MSKVGFAALQDDADDSIIQRCQHLRPITPPELAGVFVQADISPVMQTILDAPLLACNLAQSLGACYTCRQTRNAIAFLFVPLLRFVLPYTSRDAKYLLHTGPIVVARQDATTRHNPLFYPSVAFFHPTDCHWPVLGWGRPAFGDGK